jgi:hypothetical protein
MLWGLNGWDHSEGRDFQGELKAAGSAAAVKDGKLALGAGKKTRNVRTTDGSILSGRSMNTV